MDKFNDIGIDDKLDWNRIEKLMRIGIFAACMVLEGDVLIGYGMHDSSKTGMEWFYRLCKEPWRAGRMMDLPKFGMTVMLKGKKYKQED